MESLENRPKRALISGCSGRMRKIITEPKTCKKCGKEFVRTTEEASDWKNKIFCCRKCFLTFIKRENHPNWKGGIKHRPDGYLRNSQTDEYIHRETMEQYLGRKLEVWEHIHHKNGDKSDNRIENLEIFTNSAHRQLEVKKQRRDKSGKFRR